ncbi:MAG TPA: glycosyltransferase family 2 protein [Lacibacter sp.]|nr:glycosyltransferase family 2 protein [Lacibacter sp.]
MTSSLIISTYNRPEALALCLQSVLRQSVMPLEIIIADDGSAAATKQLIDGFKQESTVPVSHVWQEDEGYQLSKIRNKAFAVAKGDYLIQTDGDLIFHRHFIKDHLSFARIGSFVSGARTNINEVTTHQLIQHQIAPDLHYNSAGLEKRYNAFRNALLRNVNAALQSSPTSLHYVLGCNMAFFKADLQKVNGYNEAFTGWGKEDNDIAARLINSGIKLRMLKFGAVVFHLWHKEADKNKVSTNETLFQESLKNNVTFVPLGMNQY